MHRWSFIGVFWVTPVVYFKYQVCDIWCSGGQDRRERLFQFAICKWMTEEETKADKSLGGQVLRFFLWCQAVEFQALWELFEMSCFSSQVIQFWSQFFPNLVKWPLISQFSASLLNYLFSKMWLSYILSERSPFFYKSSGTKEYT